MRSDFGMRRAIPLAAALGLALAGAALTAPPVYAQTTQAPRFALRSFLGGGAEIGISIRDLKETEAEREKLTGLAGAYVEDVRSGSPAAEAGVKSGDVIVAFDGERVRSARHLQRLIEETPIGRTVDATVSRSGQRVTLKVTPVEPASVFSDDGALQLPDLRGFIAPNRPFPGFGANAGRLGVNVQDLGDQLGDYFGTRAGVLVTAVAAGTPAAAAGLKAGDVILKVDGTSIESVTDLRRAIADASDGVTLTIMRDHREQTLTATFTNTRPTLRQRQRTTI